MKKRTLTVGEKYFLLTDHFVPGSDYAFPFKIFSCRHRSFQASWLKKYNGLVYSIKYDGAYCKYCVLFAVNQDCRIQYGILVNQPLNNWQKATIKLNYHFHDTKYHALSVEIASNFIDTTSGRSQPISNQLKSSRIQEAKENNMILCSIVDCIITCAKQGIPLRGHRDDSKDVADNPESNHGNFLELLWFRARGGDVTLKRHLESAAKNALYTSKTIQNELIGICGDMIQKCILDDIRQAKFYSVIADEATDCANDEQLAICIRYVDTDCQIQEKFIAFSECISGVTGKDISEKILSLLSSWQLDIANLRGQAYDGAGAMSGAVKGAAARIIEKCPKAQFVHCAAHRLNLCVVKSCSVREVSNAMDCADSIVRFYKYSPKRQAFLEECIVASTSSEKRKKLKELCRTRWVERHDAFEVFINLYKPLVTCFRTIVMETSSWNRDTRNDANSLLQSLLQFPMIVALIITREILLITKGLSIKLQGPYVDMVRAYNDIAGVKKQVTENRNMAEEFHQRVYDIAIALADEVGVSECMRRTLQGRQQHRANPESSTCLEYYRRTLTIPVLDHLHAQLEERFNDNSDSSKFLMEFIKLLPSEIHEKMQQLDSSDIANIVEYYEDDLPSDYAIDVELQAWFIKWKDNPESIKYNTAPKALAKADVDFFPNLYTLLRIASTSPVTSVVCERSISTLRLLKPVLRSTMSNSRMNGLALMFIHRTLATNLNPQTVINRFSSCNNRRMHL